MVWIGLELSMAIRSFKIIARFMPVMKLHVLQQSKVIALLPEMKLLQSGPIYIAVQS
jgi:hypothetical protein